MSPDINTEGAFYRKKLFLSILIPGIFVALMWLVKAVEVLFDLDLTKLGIYPLQLKGLIGIFTSPFIHSDLKHLFNNSLPLFFLSVALFFFYSEVAIKVFSWTYLLTGLLVWLGGREAWHIGASGIVYGLASFLFFSGIIRRYFRLVALSLLIVFLYGEMVWGVFPGVYGQSVSWESHMLGVFSGIVLAVLYRKEGPQRPVQEWDNEDSSFAEASDFARHSRLRPTKSEDKGGGDKERSDVVPRERKGERGKGRERD
ncbi:MAG: rhomboid family intramembrane serine protease [Bacteroidales bacterium]|nr:rhomboid family intramembrane serine protease [Bacteroidales bacterium]